MDKKGIVLQKVSKSFQGEIVIRETSLTFEKGVIYGLIGRNGSGKTVLMKLICGFLSQDSGTIEVMGKVLGKDCDFAEYTGILIEPPGFLNGASGFRNLKYLAQIRQKIDDDKIKSTMEQVGLDWKNRKRVGKYSLGMKQRLGIAQAIMEEPDILILDEPMNGLDEEAVLEMRVLFQKLKQEGKLIILSSHNREDIDVLCDEVYEIANGIIKKVKEGA